jgi:hypothetical protein
MQRLTIAKILTTAFAAVAVTSLGIPAAGATVIPPHCDRHGVCTPPSNLNWNHPPVIVDHVSVRFASVDKCPGVRPDGSPIRGTRMVEYFITLTGGGGFGDIAPVAADGSWKFWHKFDVSGTRDLHATVSARCDDVTDTGFDIADYRPHRVQVNP